MLLEATTKGIVGGETTCFVYDTVAGSRGFWVSVESVADTT